LVALLGLAAIAYTIGASIRRRRRDFAILQAMGLTTRQLFQTLTCQAMTITLIALLVGVPLGVALGRISWRAFAQGLGVGPDAVIPVGPLTVGAATSVAVTIGIAASFFTSLRRTQPTVVLRTE
jgi:predicted lysophospholipase L1 biosynthesis ABC-type transport system permease subunit